MGLVKMEKKLPEFKYLHITFVFIMNNMLLLICILECRLHRIGTVTYIKGLLIMLLFCKHDRQNLIIDKIDTVENLLHMW